MTKRYYNRAALDRILRSLEEHFGIASADFYEAYLEDHDSPILKDVSLWDRHVWADMYRESRRLSGSDFAEQAERELEIV